MTVPPRQTPPAPVATRSPASQAGRRRSFLAPVVLLLTLLATAAAPAAEATVSFKPTGLVKRPSQVAARFDRAMIRLGDPDADVTPFDIDCSIAGRPRWRDSRNWVFEFESEVPSGVVCTFTVRDGLVALDGSAVPAETFAFSTGGPRVEAHYPPWGEIEEDGAVLLFLDGPATEESILEHVYFEADGIVERIGVQPIGGENQEAILATLPAERRDRPVAILQPRQRLAAGSKARLVWGADVQSPDGQRAASEQRIELRVREPFTVTMRCTRSAPKADCNPLLPITLHFSAPVPGSFQPRIRLRDPLGYLWESNPREDGDASFTSLRFPGPFTESTEIRVEAPYELVDEHGRSAANADAFPLTVQTAAYPPLVKFPSRFGIVEADAEPAAVVTVRNVERDLHVLAQRATEARDRSLSARVWRAFDEWRGRAHVIPATEIEHVIPWLQRLTRTPRDASIFAAPVPAAAEPVPTRFTLPKSLDPAETEVIGIPLAMPGLHLIEIESPLLGAALLGEAASMFVPAATLVTNLAVHLKWGATDSLVWVTRLSDARPVGGAEVFVLDCTGAKLWQGVTAADGTARIEALPKSESLPHCPREEWPAEFWSDDYRALRGIDGGLFVIARTADDFSFAHSSWNEGIEPWRFGVETGGYGNATPTAIHTILDRALFRAGETVHMKHLLRRRTAQGFEWLTPEGALETKVVHVATGEEANLGVADLGPGTATTAWAIPRAAKLGRYQIEVGHGDVWQTTSGFRVEEFRIPQMTGQITFPVERLIGTTAVAVDLSLAYLAGGPAGDAPVTVRTQLRPAAFAARHPWTGLRFGNGPVVAGTIQHAPYDETDAAADLAIERTEVRLSRHGTQRVSVRAPGVVSGPSELVVDMEYRDAVGEVRSAVRTLPVLPAERLVAIEPERWSGSGSDLRARVVVVDPQGKPLAGVEAEVTVHRRRSFSHRKRLIGGFYAYEHSTETTGPLETLCRGVTESHGSFACEGTTELSGNLILQATIDDGHGRSSAAHGEVWVAGPEAWWFRVEDHDRIDLVAERFELAPGDTARLQVRSPFTDATALVTVEREGILDTWVVPVSGREPVIEFPIRRAYAPNVFVSALLVRGRIGGIQPTALVDLGRPAYKLGLTELRVGWDEHRLHVDVEPSAEVFRVRQPVDVAIQVRRAGGEPPGAGAEVAIAVVDEGLLELAPNPTWNVLAALMEPRLHWVSTATAQGQVVGKRHFGHKALPVGGGGGAQTVRELFDTLVYWNPRVPVDADGRATVQFALNDSLSSFRIVAIATAGADEFGTGSRSIRSTQDLMLISALPAVVRTGDRFPARFTVRNASAAAMDVEVSLESDFAPFEPQSVQLAPGAATELAWPITVPRDRSDLHYRISARAPGASDDLAASQRVVPVLPVTTQHAELARIERPYSVAVGIPEGADAERGGVVVDLRRSLAEQTSGVIDYMDQYAFTCIEQRVSRAIVLDDAALWSEVVESLPQHQASDGLLGFFPHPTAGSVELTAYVLSVAAAAKREIPEAVREPLVQALRRTLAGQAAGDGPSGPFAPLRRLTALEALARIGEADPSMLETMRVEPAYWPLASVLDLWSITRHLPDGPDVAAWRAAAEKVLRDRLVLSGVAVGFRSDEQLGWHFLTCPDGVPLRHVLGLLESEAPTDEIGPWILAALQRQRRGHWDCTTSNAWGAIALARFATRERPDAVEGTTTAHLGEATAHHAWQPDGSTAASLELGWPAEDASLGVAHEGAGAPWALVQTRAAVPLREPHAAGYRLQKWLEPAEQRTPGRFSRGDVWRVRIEVVADDDAAWVVIDDPLPPGAAHLGTGLGAAALLGRADSDKPAPWWATGPTYIERRHESFRAYYEWFRRGPATLSYTIRLNQDGAFDLPPTRIEAMYAPERYGALPNPAVEIDP